MGGAAMVAATPDCGAPGDLIAAADDALRAAKSAGGHRVSAHTLRDSYGHLAPDCEAASLRA